MATSIAQLSSAQTLTGTATAATNTAIVDGMNYHTLNMEYTPGASGNVLTVVIQHRVKAVTDGQWTQEMEWNDSPAGTKIPTLEQLKSNAAPSTVLIPLYYFFQGHYGEVRILISESGSVFGTLTAYLNSSNT